MNSKDLQELSKKSAKKVKTSQTKWDKKHFLKLKEEILTQAKLWADEGETTAYFKITGDKDILAKVAKELSAEGFRVHVDTSFTTHRVTISWK